MTGKLGTYLSEIGNYAKDVYRTAWQDFWKNEFPKYYKGLIKVGDKFAAIIELPPEYFPSRVLGMTDCLSTILIRNDLHKFGYGAKNFVVEHEVKHIELAEKGEPYWDENLVDKLAMRKLGLSYRPV